MYEQLNEELADHVYEALGHWQSQSARSQQSSRRVLGMSDLGGCLEYIRATIAGDERAAEPALKWPAFLGTAVGDLAERALGEEIGAETQQYVTVTLPKSGIQVSGSTDAVIFENHLLDFKTKDRLDAVREDGPDEGQKIQIAGYFVGMVQAGRMSKEGTASLVFLDRSGAQPRPWVWSMSYADAEGWLEWADDRLETVALALATGQSQGHLRTKPESWCFHVKCPFFAQCWDTPDYQPTGTIDAPEHIAAIELYDRGRKMAKEAEGLQRAAKQTLGAYKPADEDPVEGETTDGKWRLKFTLTEGGRYVSRRIDLRALSAKR